MFRGFAPRNDNEKGLHCWLCYQYGPECGIPVSNTRAIFGAGYTLGKAMNPIEITVPRLHKDNIHAITLWPFIFFRRGFQDDPALRCHEFFHWRQALRWGVIPWYLTYLLLQLYYFRRPADQHPLEAPAYARQREVLRLLDAGESIDQHLSELGVTERV